MRQLTDEQGTRWEIFQVSGDMLTAGRVEYLPTQFRDGWLVFDSGVERRRLAPFPNDWRVFTPDALLALLRSTERPEPRRSPHSAPAAPIAPPIERERTDRPADAR